MGRWLATLGILVLLALDLLLPRLPIARQGAEVGRRRADAPGAVGRVGEELPDLTLRDLEGRPLRIADLRGHRVLLTFERSLDW
jgi:hypothetical protein